MAKKKRVLLFLFSKSTNSQFTVDE